MVGYEGGKYAEGAKRAKAKLLGTYQKALSLYSDGISKDQLATVLRKQLAQNPTNADLEAAAQLADSGGVISLDDLCFFLVENAKPMPSQTQLAKAFTVLDKDGSGYLEKDELKKIVSTVGEKFSSDELAALDAVLLKVGGDNGKIDFAEFSNLVTGGKVGKCLCLYASNTPDQKDFVKCLRENVVAVKYDFAKATAESLTSAINAKASLPPLTYEPHSRTPRPWYSTCTKPQVSLHGKFDSIMLANHGPGGGDVWWRVSELVKLESADAASTLLEETSPCGQVMRAQPPALARQSHPLLSDTRISYRRSEVRSSTVAGWTCLRAASTRTRRASRPCAFARGPALPTHRPSRHVDTHRRCSPPSRR